MHPKMSAEAERMLAKLRVSFNMLDYVFKFFPFIKLSCLYSMIVKYNTCPKNRETLCTAAEPSILRDGF